MESDIEIRICEWRKVDIFMLENALFCLMRIYLIYLEGIRIYPTNWVIPLATLHQIGIRA